MQTEGDILRIEVKRSKLTQEEFAAEMGFSRNYLLRLMERAVLPTEIKEKASKILKIDIAKLNSVQLQTSEANVVNESAATYESSVPIGSAILHVPIEAEAGFIGGAITPAMNYDLRPWSLPGFDEPGFSFSVKGLSMFNTLKEGEIIVTGQKREEFVLIRKDYIYVIVTKDNIVTKRVNKHPDGRLTLVSDNPEYKPFDVGYDDVILYRGRRCVTYDLSKKFFK